MSNKQIVFYRQFTEKLPVPLSSGTYLLCWIPADAVRHLRLLIRTFGVWKTVQAVLKILRGNRKLYLVTEQNAGVHWGWISISFCHYYPVQSGDVVIGPIETAPSARGKGFATFAMIQTINRLIEMGYSKIYIDTDDKNFSCLKVIEKCQFGNPKKTFIKTDGHK